MFNIRLEVSDDVLQDGGVYSEDSGSVDQVEEEGVPVVSVPICHQGQQSILLLPHVQCWNVALLQYLLHILQPSQLVESYFYSFSHLKLGFSFKMRVEL